MPYFVPACALSTIGMSTITLPRKIVTTACHQFIPPLTSEEASWYVGMHADMEIHSAAIDRTDHFRCAAVVGARSGFHSGESANAPTLGVSYATIGIACVVISNAEHESTRMVTNLH